MEWFSMIWFSFLLVNVQLLVRIADGKQITWYKPPPVETATSPSVTFAANILQLYDGYGATLLWNFSLSQDLSVTSVDLEFNSVLIVRLSSNGGVGVIAAAFQDRFSVDWKPPGRVAMAISNVASADDKVNGAFSCVVATLSGDWERQIQVEVVAPTTTPEIRGERTVREGGNLQLTCEASGKPDPNITWTPDNLGNQGNIGVQQEGKVLTITKISRNDSGIFTCTAHNGINEPKSQAVYVNVTYPAKIVEFQDEYIVDVQQSVTLNCEAEGNPPPTYTWTPCGFKQVCHKNTLNISQVLEDANYTCRVANVFKSDSKTAYVYIGGDLVYITIVITSETYEDEKYNQSSLLEKLRELLKGAFASKPGYEGVQFIDVRSGSITVDLALKFKFPTKEKDVITTLNAALKDGKLGEFSVSSIKGTRHDVATTSPTTTPTDGSSVGMDWWEILLIALGVASVFGLVVGICYWKYGHCCPCCTKNNGSKEVHSNGGQDVETPVGYSSADDQYAAAGPNASYRASKPSSLPPATYEVAYRRSEGRRGNGASEPKEPPPQYAEVDKTKKKKKTPKPGELQYAELGELTGPRQKAVLPLVSGTDTVYSDIRT